MKKKTKFLLIAIIGVLSFTILLVFNFYLSKTEPTLSDVENISLIVDYNNGTIKGHYNFTLDGGKTTVFDALDKWCKVEYQESSLGIFVTAIDGIRGSWIYLVNGYSPEFGSKVYALKDGDLVKWLRVG